MKKFYKKFTNEIKSSKFQHPQLQKIFQRLLRSNNKNNLKDFSNFLKKKLIIMKI